MGWERGRYYTRSRKVKGRVVRQYVGCGRTGKLAARADERRRAQRLAEAAAWVQEKRHLAAVDEAVSDLCGLADLVSCAALLAVGYHRPKRQWRKKRMSVPVPNPAAAACPAATRTVEEYVGWMKRAQNGDEAALPVVRELLAQEEAVNSFSSHVVGRAEEAVVKAITGRNLLFREALLRKLRLLRAELAGPRPAAVERLLVEHVVACWLQVQQADRLWAQLDNVTLAQGDYHQRRQDRAHRRFLAAMKTLAQVRRLALPVLLQQINVAAQQQVNVAG
jgi:hypothetical protein